MTPPRVLLVAQFHLAKVRGLTDVIAQACSAAGVPVWIGDGIASRETNYTNELGDFRDGEYHGVGLVQVDIQHPAARVARDTGVWKRDPGPLANFGMQLLAGYFRQVGAALPDLTTDARWKVACSAYNCGPEAAIEGSKLHGDSDHGTSHGDYGADVVARAVIFKALRGL